MHTKPHGYPQVAWDRLDETQQRALLDRIAAHRQMLDAHSAAWAIAVVKDPSLLDNKWVNWPEEK